MVNPVIGPIFTESFNDVEGAGSFWKRKWAYRQSRPYNLPLPYAILEYRTLGASPEENAGALGNAHAGHTPWYAWASARDRGDPLTELAVGKARERFFSDLGSSAQLSTTFGEWRQSLKMIKNRAGILTGGFKLLKAGRPKQAFDLLTHGDSSGRILASKYKTSKSFANQWLEVHFGIVPLVQDIWNAVDTLQSPIPYGRCYGSGSHAYSVSGSGLSPEQWSNAGTQTGKVRCRVGARVTVSNPNLYLANRLGLLNPASLAWELTPWSFVVDWFTNVGDFLGQFTDQVGLVVDDPWYSIRSEEKCHYTYVIIGNPQNPYLVLQTSCDYFVRRQGLPEIRLSVKPAKAPSVTRAATAISLLIQQLPSRH